MTRSRRASSMASAAQVLLALASFSFMGAALLTSKLACTTFSARVVLALLLLANLLTSMASRWILQSSTEG